MSSIVNVAVYPHWVNGWFLRWAARAYLVLDQEEHRLSWGRALSFELDSGVHRMAVGIRYKGFSSLMGAAPMQVRLEEGQRLDFTARNGLLNSTPFMIRRDDDGSTHSA